MIHRPSDQYRDMLPILEADTYGFWADFSRRPGGESGVDGRGLWWRSGVPFVTYNGIAVRRRFQRRGLGTLATLVTVREGARRGASIATLQATRAGFPVYERLGFQTITSFRAWC